MSKGVRSHARTHNIYIMFKSITFNKYVAHKCAHRMCEFTMHVRFSALLYCCVHVCGCIILYMYQRLIFEYITRECASAARSRPFAVASLTPVPVYGKLVIYARAAVTPPRVAVKPIMCWRVRPTAQRAHASRGVHTLLPAAQARV